MKIYEPMVARDYEWVNCIDEDDYEVIMQLNGLPVKSRWRPIKVKLVRADQRQECRRSDFPWLGSHAIIMRESAVNALRDIIENCCELLPIQTDDDARLWLCNAQVLDAVDYAKSDIVYFPGTRRVMRIKKLVLLPEVVNGSMMFRLPHRSSGTFVGQLFVDRVNRSGLEGLEFTEVKLL